MLRHIIPPLSLSPLLNWLMTDCADVLLPTSNALQKQISIQEVLNNSSIYGIDRNVVKAMMTTPVRPTFIQRCLALVFTPFNVLGREINHDLSTTSSTLRVTLRYWPKNLFRCKNVARKQYIWSFTVASLGLWCPSKHQQTQWRISASLFNHEIHPYCL